MSKKLVFSILVLLLVFATGCTTTSLLNFTIISSKSLPAEDLQRLERREKRVSGQTDQQIYVIFPVGAVDIQKSLDRAIESEPGCVALVDGSVTLYQRIFFPLIYADSKIVVEGTPLIDPTRIENRDGSERSSEPD
jgi:hypothetical protein